MFSKFAPLPLPSAFKQPQKKLSVVGGGIIGLLEVYFEYLEAKKNGQRLRATVYEKNKSITDTTAVNIAPSLTPDEILSVVPPAPVLIEKLRHKFNVPGGIRVDDVPGINDSETAENFKKSVQINGLNAENHALRQKILLNLGKKSMDLWDQIYNNADDELKAILEKSNFKPCKHNDHEIKKLGEGYRIDLIFQDKNASFKAVEMQKTYKELGYFNCDILSPLEAMEIDPFIKDFCLENSERNLDGNLVWKSDAIAVWRPGGCLDTSVFLPLFVNYLSKVMGHYINAENKLKNCFRYRTEREVNALYYPESDNLKGTPFVIKGLGFEGTLKTKFNKYAYDKSDYVFCPGEAVGTLRKLGLQEPDFARFAGPSLKLQIKIPEDRQKEFLNFNHCMELHQEGVVLAFQARYLEGKVLVAVAGTKAFYGDKTPHKNEEFCLDRNILQLNIINNALPAIISMALNMPTQGKLLTEENLKKLESDGIATRWVGSRAVIYDGFPTLGSVYHLGGTFIDNARATTHLGSGGVSFGPAAVWASRGGKSTLFANGKLDEAFSSSEEELAKNVLSYGSSMRKPAGYIFKTTTSSSLRI